MIMGKITLLWHLLFVIHFINCEHENRKISSVQPKQHDFASEANAERLHDAIIGVGTDESAIIAVLIRLSPEERQNVRYAYKEMYNKDLVADLDGDISGNFKQVVHALLLEPHYYLAKKINEALYALVTDYSKLNEILCTKSRDYLQRISDAYIIQFNKTLLNEIDETLKGDLRDFFKMILSEPLRKKGDVNSTKANEQLNLIPNSNLCGLQEIHKPVDMKKYTMLMEMMSKESFEQIALVGDLYKKSNKFSIVEKLKMWCTTHDVLRSSYVTLARYAVDPMKFYAEELYSAMEGLGTNNDKLQRIIIERREIDLFNIKQKYEELYKKSLIDAVKDDTSGNYEKILIKLIERSDQTGVSKSLYS